MAFNSNSFGSDFDPNRNRYGDASRIMDRSGQNYRDVGLDPGGDNETSRMFRNLSVGDYAPAASRNAFNANLEGDYQKRLMNLLKSLDNRNYAAEGQRARASVMANYGQAQQYADQSARAAGLGTGAQLGALRGLSSQASRAGNAAELAANDPQRKIQDLLQAIGITSQAQATNPFLDNLFKYFAAIEQRQGAKEAAKAARAATSPGATIGNALGVYLGGLGGGGAAGAAGLPAGTYGTEAGVRPGSWYRE